MYEINTIEEHQEVKERQAAYESWSKQFRQKNGWIIIPPEAVPPVKFDNDDRSAIELWEWKHDPPEKYFLYIRENDKRPEGFPYEPPLWEAITFAGQKLGNVRYATEYKCPAFGGWPSVRQSITVYGNNGVKYYGTYYKSSGDYARIKMMKNQG